MPGEMPEAKDPTVGVVTKIGAQGHGSLRAIAAELNARGMLTRRGGRWHVSNVRNLLARLETAGMIGG